MLQVQGAWSYDLWMWCWLHQRQNKTFTLSWIL